MHRLKYLSIAIVLLLMTCIGAIAVYQKTHGPASFVGLSEIQAVERAKSRDVPYRIVRRDSQKFMLTDDFQRHRLNFEIDKGKVTEVKRY
jgi:hypothetical protein